MARRESSAASQPSTGITVKEITDLLRKRIEAFEPKVRVAEIGRVIDIGSGIARISGLPQVMVSELLEFPPSGERRESIHGIAFNLEADNVGAIIMGDHTSIKEGDPVVGTGCLTSVPVGEALIERVVNALGEPVDGKGPIDARRFRPVERIAPRVVARKRVDTPLQTGIKAIDSMTPIGRGQRELIIGDRQIGKTALAVDTIINQKDEDLICIYVAIGQKRVQIARVVATLEAYGALEHTVIVAASASEPAAMQYLAPYAGCAMGEEFMEQGQDALVVYDDLTKHAWAYREISLLLRRPPGREAYPGDIFYIHSRLLERAAKLAPEYGGGSLTALPIVETQEGEISAYIPTNLISITDGQIYLEADLFNAGVRPALNVGLSVSRVGGAAQINAMKQVAGRLRLDLAQFREFAAFVRFSSELDQATRERIAHGQRITEILKQPQYEPMAVEKQVMSLYAVVNGFLDDVPIGDIRNWEGTFHRFMDERHPGVEKAIAEEKDLSEATKAALEAAIEEFNQQFLTTS